MYACVFCRSFRKYYPKFTSTSEIEDIIKISCVLYFWLAKVLYYFYRRPDLFILLFMNLICLPIILLYFIRKCSQSAYRLTRCTIFLYLSTQHNRTPYMAYDFWKCYIYTFTQLFYDSPCYPNPESTQSKTQKCLPALDIRLYQKITFYYDDNR